MAEFDVIVIGAGPGGYVCAIRCAQLGLKAAIVEKRAAGRKAGPKLGGTCLNVGCIPSKALLDSSHHFANARDHFADHGVVVEPPRLDLAAMMKRKDGVVQGLVDGVSYLMKKNRVTVLAGHGRLTADGAVCVTAENGTTTEHRAKDIVLAMGSVPIELPFLPFDGRDIVSSDQAIAFDTVPERLLVVGGGVIGLELGSVWSRLGAQVEVIEFLPRICPFLDPDVGQAFARSLVKQGLAFHLETKVTGLERVGDELVLQAEQNGQATALRGDQILVAVGRRPLIEDCGLEAAGITLTDRKRVLVDDQLRTTRERVWAIGDLVEGPMLAHKAEEEGVAVAERIVGKGTPLDHHLIPNVVYTHPEVASVGASEASLKEAGVAFKTGSFPFQANGRAKAAADTEGFVKILADADTDRILGASVLGPRASDLLAEITAVMAFAGASEDLARTCHSHPTFSEAVREAALAVDGRALHS